MAQCPVMQRFRNILMTGAPERPPLRHILVATLLLGLPLFTIGLVGDGVAERILIPPTAATAALIVGAPDLPLSQPRNVVLGHMVGGVVGVVMGHYFGGSLHAGGAAAAIAFGLMLILRCAHSPGTATAMLATVAPAASPLRFLALLFVAAWLAVITGLIANRVRRLRYPTYWW